jgi:hypothetical protein
LQPATSLVFDDEVTAAGKIFEQQKKAGDPNNRTLGTITFSDPTHIGGMPSLNLPIGTNNTPAAMRQIIQVPPASESPTSLLGQQRYYNLADMVVLISDAGVTATSGAFNGFATPIPAAQRNLFINPSASFFNARENKTIKCTDIDIAMLRKWNGSNAVLRPLQTLFIADSRTQSGSTEPGVRLINGEMLPPKGLTVATPNPIYIRGNYNVTVSGTPVNLGTTNTTATVPASVAADAVTILSGNWSDGNSDKDIGSRVAASTTVNCAILAGNVATVSGSYSGGLENFPRFLEDWSGQTLTYNGSLVALFDSVFATAPWSGNGASVAIYSPPIRNWAFDQNFNDITKIPPSSPQVRLMIRGAWAD